MATIKVNIQSDSYHFREHAAVQIRDSNMKLLKLARSNQRNEYSVKPGLYQVSAVLEDGREHKQYVRVEQGGTAEVGFEAGVDDDDRDGQYQQSYRIEQYHAPRYTKAMASRSYKKALAEREENAKPKSVKPKSNKLKSAKSKSSKRKTKPPRRTRASGARMKGLNNKSRAKSAVFGNRGFKGSAGADASDAMELPEAAMESMDLDEFEEALATGAEENWTEEAEAADEQFEQATDIEESNAAPATVAQIQLSGAHLLDETVNPWLLKCDDSIDQIAIARLRVGEIDWELSLPTSPHDVEDYNSCVVMLEESIKGVRPVAWISPERTVANAMQNMLASSQLLSARELAGSATELLRGKYLDPTGATLGALLLYKFDLLEPKLAWLENLARDFSWIPDAKILLAAELLRSSEPSVEKQQRAFELALQASEQRVLYTECYSILLELFRRSLRQLDEHKSMQIAEKLGLGWIDMDWDSICVSSKNEE